MLTVSCITLWTVLFTGHTNVKQSLILPPISVFHFKSPLAAPRGRDCTAEFYCIVLMLVAAEVVVVLAEAVVAAAALIVAVAKVHFYSCSSCLVYSLQ